MYNIMKLRVVTCTLLIFSICTESVHAQSHRSWYKDWIWDKQYDIKTVLVDKTELQQAYNTAVAAQQSIPSTETSTVQSNSDLMKQVERAKTILDEYELNKNCTQMLQNWQSMKANSLLDTFWYLSDKFYSSTTGAVSSIYSMASSALHGNVGASFLSLRDLAMSQDGNAEEQVQKQAISETQGNGQMAVDVVRALFSNVMSGSFLLKLTTGIVVIHPFSWPVLGAFGAIAAVQAPMWWLQQQESEYLKPAVRARMLFAVRFQHEFEVCQADEMVMKQAIVDEIQLQAVDEPLLHQVLEGLVMQEMRKEIVECAEYCTQLQSTKQNELLQLDWLRRFQCVPISERNSRVQSQFVPRIVVKRCRNKNGKVVRNQPVLCKNQRWKSKSLNPCWRATGHWN